MRITGTGLMNIDLPHQHPERWASALGGAALIVWGANRLARDRGPAGALLATTGAGLIWNAARPTDTRARLGGSRGIVVEESVAINREPEELYDFWRRLQCLPMIMPELESVQVLDDVRSHWVATGPGRWRLEWDAEIINEWSGELIAWKTVGNPDLVSAGSIHFKPGDRGRGTIVRVKMQYNVTGGKMTALVAKAFGEAPSQVVREGLRRFKQLMEAGEIATIEGQPRGAR
jgi:uncharacterized membrane protein